MGGHSGDDEQAVRGSRTNGKFSAVHIQYNMDFLWYSECEWLEMS